MSAPSRPGEPSQRIRPLAAEDLEAVVELSVLAWEPVFASFEAVLGGRISRRLYRPDPRTAQAENVRTTCLADDVDAFVSLASDGAIAGFLALREHADGPTGEIDLLAVHPRHQRRGHARALVEFAVQRFRDRGFPLVDVGTGGDPAHARARALYESVGFTGLPLVHYYRALGTDPA